MLLHIKNKILNIIILPIILCGCTEINEIIGYTGIAGNHIHLNETISFYFSQGINYIKLSQEQHNYIIEGWTLFGSEGIIFENNDIELDMDIISWKDRNTGYITSINYDGVIKITIETDIILSENISPGKYIIGIVLPNLNKFALSNNSIPMKLVEEDDEDKRVVEVFTSNNRISLSTIEVFQSEKERNIDIISKLSWFYIPSIILIIIIIILLIRTNMKKEIKEK